MRFNYFVEHASPIDIRKHLSAVNKYVDALKSLTTFFRFEFLGVVFKIVKILVISIAYNNDF